MERKELNDGEANNNKKKNFLYPPFQWSYFLQHTKFVSTSDEM